MQDRGHSFLLKVKEEKSMFRNLKIRAKITGLIIALVAIVALAFAIFTYQVNVKAQRDKLNSSVTAFADQQAIMLNYFFSHVAASVKFLQNSEQFKIQVKASPDSLAQTLQNIKEIYGLGEVYLADKNGTVLVSTDRENGKGKNLADLDKSYFDRALNSFQLSAVRKSGESYFTFGAAALNDKIIALKINLDPIYKKLADGNIGKSGECYLAQIDPVSQKIIIVSPLRNDPGSFLKPLDANNKATQEMRMAIDGQNGSSISPDYRGKETLKVFRKIDQAGWGLVVKIDTGEINGQGNELVRIYLAGGIAL